MRSKCANTIIGSNINIIGGSLDGHFMAQPRLTRRIIGSIKERIKIPWIVAKVSYHVYGSKNVSTS